MSSWKNIPRPLSNNLMYIIRIVALTWLFLGGIFFNDILMFVVLSQPSRVSFTIKGLTGLLIVMPGLLGYIFKLTANSNNSTAAVVPKSDVLVALRRLADWADEAIIVKCPLTTFSDSMKYNAVWGRASSKRKRFVALEREPIKIWYVDDNNTMANKFQEYVEQYKFNGTPKLSSDASSDIGDYTVWRRHRFNKLETIVTLDRHDRTLGLVIADSSVDWVNELAEKASSYIG